MAYTPGVLALGQFRGRVIDAADAGVRIACCDRSPPDRLVVLGAFRLGTPRLHEGPKRERTEVICVLRRGESKNPAYHTLIRVPDFQSDRPRPIIANFDPIDLWGGESVPWARWLGRAGDPPSVWSGEDPAGFAAMVGKSEGRISRGGAEHAEAMASSRAGA